MQGSTGTESSKKIMQNELTFVRMAKVVAGCRFQVPGIFPGNWYLVTGNW